MRGTGVRFACGRWRVVTVAVVVAVAAESNAVVVDDMALVKGWVRRSGDQKSERDKGKWRLGSRTS
jgi:hypothetical protein